MLSCEIMSIVMSLSKSFILRDVGLTCGLVSCEAMSYVESLFKSSILRDVEMTC
jgi:hypothetical protein